MWRTGNHFLFPEVQAGGLILAPLASLCESIGLDGGRLLEMHSLQLHMQGLGGLLEVFCNGVITAQLSVTVASFMSGIHVQAGEG